MLQYNFRFVSRLFIDFRVRIGYGVDHESRTRGICNMGSSLIDRISLFRLSFVLTSFGFRFPCPLTITEGHNVKQLTTCTGDLTIIFGRLYFFYQQEVSKN